MSHARLQRALAAFRDRTVVVVGDLIAAEYLFGKPARISREAPVLILKVTERMLGLGGAANAAHNVHDLGARVVPVGVVGRDAPGDELLGLFREAGDNNQRISVMLEMMRILENRLVYLQNFIVDPSSDNRILAQLVTKFIDQISSERSTVLTTGGYMAPSWSRDGRYIAATKTSSFGTDVVILVTRLNGAVFALNPDLVERADCTPDTVVTLVDGTKYVIAESVPEFIDSVRHYRASLISQASRLDSSEPTARDENADEQTAVVVPLHRKER